MQRIRMRLLVLLFIMIKILISGLWAVNAISDGRHVVSSWRGGAATTKRKSLSLNDDLETSNDAYKLLAKSVRKKLKSDDENGSLPEISDIVKAFKSLASAQKTFKGLDGAAHEAYQRTHHQGDDEVDIISVSGRARRSAARAGATADGLGACELCELWELPVDQKMQQQLHQPNSTLGNRKVLLNVTNAVSEEGLNISILVLYEASYEGGAGVDHGGIDDGSTPSNRKRVLGRLLIVLGESGTPTLQKTLKVLHRTPIHVRLHKGLVASEAASVQSVLYKAAGSVLGAVEPILRSYNETTAIHFTGRSLAGGVSAIAATILDGGLPMPGEKKTKKPKKQARGEAPSNDSTTRVVSTTNTSESGMHGSSSTSTSLSGLGRGRTSAVTLGTPPCFSANVQSEFIISILYGDDIVCRSTKESLDRFLERTRRSLKQKWIIGRQMNWMSDTISLATSNLKSHAIGSEGEELRLATPGRAYLVRPRRLGHACSMHEVGTQLKGGREALRAAVLWQLNDVLLSKSLWKHHQLDSYISGLDRVHLRGLHEDDDDESV